MINTEYENGFAAFLEKLNFKGKAMNDLFATNKAGLMDTAMLGALMGGFLAQSVKQKATITVQITKDTNAENVSIADLEEENNPADDDEKEDSHNNELKHLRDRFILELAERGVTPLQISQILRVRLRFINNLLRKQKGGETY
ncbi:MAG: Hypothetical protein BHV28_10680 [Candidatus Tokpelaia hoelldobleri]|uniref:Uncharacterized protein n=1 Tax=Candidatus Tokpelaia hoelldobleri TaxID=1902579 RepID=A0A1U9JV79_9HYPH|nr:MAG: Hypothetical protein BHV28_10680 [Candidatus Tokpelaia hoelldoblerii]